MKTLTKRHVTQILRDWSGGDQKALDELFTVVYRELRRMAGAYMRRERPNHTLQPTALINEAYLKLVDESAITWQNRAHFFAVAAQIMRRVLVDYARKHAADKRGGGKQKLTLDEGVASGEERNLDLIKLDEALIRLKEIDEEKSQIVELRFFGGLSIEETAESLGIAPATVKRKWQASRLWLRRELG
jgi:RNA polymerase sigma factor (TIGR02999 family)